MIIFFIELFPSFDEKKKQVLLDMGQGCTTEQSQKLVEKYANSGSRAIDWPTFLVIFSTQQKKKKIFFSG